MDNILEELIPNECFNVFGFIQFDCLLMIYPPHWYSEKN